jgi:SulP family sulfate permease
MARTPALVDAATQVSSGLILGLSAVIYAISYAALMFPGDLAPLVPHAITVTLITAALGALYGLFSEDATLVSGPEANTSSVLAGMLAAATATTLPGDELLNRALVLLISASVAAALTYLLIERFGLARLVRFIPFQVMAGFLASTGWLMSSGALNIMAGLSLTRAGLEAWLARPLRPELLVGLALAALLDGLNRRYRPAVVVPVFVVVVTLVVNGITRGLCPDIPACASPIWFFQPFAHLPWTAPWELRLDAALVRDFAALLPSFLAVAFVGTLTLLLSLSSLEHTYHRDFHLEPALRTHGLLTLAAASVGGYMSIISVGRSMMAKQTGGGRASGVVSAAVCLGVLLGLAWVVAWIPKVALAALVMWLGVGMLRQWFWDLRHSVSRADWLQIGAILVCVVVFGYVVGFFVGLLAACIFFVVTYSRMPSIRLATTLATVRSSVIREVGDQQYLSTEGGACRVGRFEGYVFFGVANSIYEWYRGADPAQFKVLVLDFTHARGMDHSAATVIGKIIRAEAARGERLILALGDETRKALLDNLGKLGDIPLPDLTGSFDTALELAEEYLLALRPPEDGDASGARASPALRWIDQPEDRDAFMRYVTRVEVAEGSCVCAEGQASDEMYFIEQGRLEVVKASNNHHGFRLAKVVAGSMIGEMALYSGQPRTASVLAVDAAVLLMLTLADWKRMQQERPDLARQLDHYVIRGLANRVSRASAALSQQET